MKRETIIENGIELTKHIFYYDNGNIQGEYYCKEDKFHRENGPAVIWYYKDGNIEREYYCKEDKFHRENGPAVIWYYKNGNIERE